MTDRLKAVMAMNPGFAKALENGEDWAVKRAEIIRGLDGKASRRFPERALLEDGKTPRNFCGSCPWKQGCITCDLPERTDPEAKREIGIWDD